jgi:hypothetical protein
VATDDVVARVVQLGGHEAVVVDLVDLQRGDDVGQRRRSGAHPGIMPQRTPGPGFPALWLGRLSWNVMRSTKASAIAAAVTVAGFWAAAGIAHADPAPPAPPAPKTTIDANGTYKVGADIAPGTYTSAGPITDGVCSWKRSAGDSIVDNAMTKKPQVVEIDPTDTTFTTRDCQPWQLTDCSQGCASTTASPAAILGQLGTFLAPRLGGPPPAGPPPPPSPEG